MENRYCYRSRISEESIVKVVGMFANDLTAQEISARTAISRVTVNTLLSGIRRKLAEFCDLNAKDNDYTGNFEFKMNALGSANKLLHSIDPAHFLIAVFTDEERLFTDLLPVLPKADIINSLTSRHPLDCVLRFKKNAGFSKFIDLSYLKKWEMIQAGQFELPLEEATKKKKFYEILRQRSLRLRGVHSSTVYLHVKECEFRYNYSGQPIEELILLILEDNPLNMPEIKLQQYAVA